MNEKYYDVSPYAYCANDPVNLVDPDGMDWYKHIDNNGIEQFVYDDDVYSQEDLDVSDLMMRCSLEKQSINDT